ncbi:MAG: AbrB/MazE/SpoVT family DNA-binding domain-containing protein [Halobacteriaceae archaeon]
MRRIEEGTTVTNTSKGQVTIPKEFRDKFNIDTSGRVRSIENGKGEVVIRPFKRPSELRGGFASQDEEEERDLDEHIHC